MLAHAQDMPEPEPRCSIFEMFPQSGQDVTILDARRAPSAKLAPLHSAVTTFARC